MQILSIKRPTTKPSTGLKIYAKVEGDSGVVYQVGYFRRPSFRGWLCSCPNFVLSQFAQGGHCKHIDLIQEQYGRYGAQVNPTRKLKAKVAVTSGDITLPGDEQSNVTNS